MEEMVTGMVSGRRSLLKVAAGATGVSLLSGKAFASELLPATVSNIAPEHRAIVARARAELDRVSAHLWRRDKVGIVDYGRPSHEPRLFIVDMVAGKVKPFLVAHGRGSDPEHDGYLNSFSNVPGSLASSRGAYCTMQWYTGKYGSSMRLEGLDPDNNLALDRAIVVHEAWYCAPDMITKWGKLGRSEGCFAVSPGMNKEMLYHLGGGRLLFADKIS